jgi:3-oxoacyl-[acyl-carrier-protein] synthase-3
MAAHQAAIRAIATHLPEQRLTNEQLAGEYQDWNVAKIFEKTGIAVRGLASVGECASDLGVAAARKLFASGVCAPDEIDFLLFCTQSPDHFLPASCCRMQTELGLRTSCGALDFNQGCSGYVYGLSLAKGLIESHTARNVLLITAETYSKFIHPQDRSVRTIFSDGAAATLVAATPDDRPRIGPFVLGTDGRGAGELCVPAGGCRQPRSADTAVERTDTSGNVRSDDHLYMNGSEIFTFTIRAIPSLIPRLLEAAELNADDVDLYVFHQANRFMLEHLRKKTGIAPEKFCINLESYGNTVSSTIPMALETALAQQQIGSGDRVMLVGFGVGYSWGACLAIVP